MPGVFLRRHFPEGGIEWHVRRSSGCVVDSHPTGQVGWPLSERARCDDVVGTARENDEVYASAVSDRERSRTFYYDVHFRPRHVVGTDDIHGLVVKEAIEEREGVAELRFTWRRIPVSPFITLYSCLFTTQDVHCDYSDVWRREVERSQWTSEEALRVRCITSRKRKWFSVRFGITCP